MSRTNHSNASGARRGSKSKTGKIRILFATSPLLAPNCPYPATAFLTAYLRKCGFDAVQDDFSVKLLSEIFTRNGLESLAETARMNAVSKRGVPPSVCEFLTRLPQYLDAIGPVMRFVRGGVAEPGLRIPEGPQFAEITELQAANPKLAKQAASDMMLRAGLFLDDIADFIRDGADAKFGFARYAESLAVSAPSFDPIKRALACSPSPVDIIIDRLASESADAVRPDVLGISVPFPGCLYAACRIAAVFRKKIPGIKIVFGGGYVSTELRFMTDTGIFAYADALCFDDGEIPLSQFAAAVEEGRDWSAVPMIASSRRLPEETLAAGPESVLRHSDRPAPVYSGLPLGLYFPMAESVNKMHRLWSDRFWNKLVLAHGCYWGKCAFCDTSLDYIKRFDGADADTVIRWMDAVADETGCKSFHFADEAAPPALLRTLSENLSARGSPYEWWTNIRLDRSFDRGLCKTMAAGGCIAVSAGLECATDRMLVLMNKGVSEKDASAVCRALSDAGMLVHLYMMYGFPTQTKEEAVMSLEILRKLFKNKYVHSAFWHRFALTCHSPALGRRKELGTRVRTRNAKAVFARNEIRFSEKDPPDWAKIGAGLNAALYNYQRGVCLNFPASEWFEEE